MGSQGWTTWVYILTLPLTSSVTLTQITYLSKLYFKLEAIPTSQNIFDIEITDKQHLLVIDAQLLLIIY